MQEYVKTLAACLQAANIVGYQFVCKRNEQEIEIDLVMGENSHYLIQQRDVNFSLFQSKYLEKNLETIFNSFEEVIREIVFTEIKERLDDIFCYLDNREYQFDEPFVF